MVLEGPDCPRQHLTRPTCPRRTVPTTAPSGSRPRCSAGIAWATDRRLPRRSRRLGDLLPSRSHRHKGHSTSFAEFLGVLREVSLFNGQAGGCPANCERLAGTAARAQRACRTTSEACARQGGWGAPGDRGTGRLLRHWFDGDGCSSGWKAPALSSSTQAAAPRGAEAHQAPSAAGPRRKAPEHCGFATDEQAVFAVLATIHPEVRRIKLAVTWPAGLAPASSRTADTAGRRRTHPSDATSRRRGCWRTGRRGWRAPLGFSISTTPATRRSGARVT